ncbi:protein of unknown function [Marinobacter sp. es.048]|uniref:DUF853 family protein n=1 Tax=Marinobacter sp. es.048 TaxID=1761795 RepID=UPI000B7626FF|nr:DUF853 family protein [Marinobacter sp. es.048]SNC59402.1 protein of unknown function [Marinobacter sp. es.048]
MSLCCQPLIVLKGVDSKPLHGRYADLSSGLDAHASIQSGMDRSVVITFEDANRHLITLGATGTRKTTSVQAPVILRMIDTGCSGLVVDVKGEYRHLAEKYPDRVMVIGADKDATPYNLIQGLSDEQFTAFLNEHRTSTKEPYWGAMGVQDAKFVRKTYQLMGQEPTLADIVDALKDPQTFVRLCDAFFKYQRSLPGDYLDLFKAVRSNRFSILAMGDSSLLDVGSPGMDDVQKQYSWQTNGLISALAPFSTDACLREKFSPKWAENAEEPESEMPRMQDLLYRDRKVLLMDIPVDRFGQTAHVISRLMRIRLVSAITGFRQHRQVGCGRDFYTFFAADEYQHLINIDQEGASNGLFDDTTFFDRCRGYGHINVVATQSVSALQARTSERVAVDCLLQNIGTVICFSSADPATDRLLKGRVSAFDAEQISSVVRSDLSAGEAYVIGRALEKHGRGTLVSRVKADFIPGAPHMSRYFSGMPDPIAIPRYESVPRVVKNPFHETNARPPMAGALALKHSFREGFNGILQELELSQGDLSPDKYEVDVLVCEDASCSVILKGFMEGSIPTLWQPGLSLVVELNGVHGWRCEIPMITMMPFVEYYMRPCDRRVREHEPLQSGLAGDLLKAAEQDADDGVEIVPAEEGDEVEEAAVRFLVRDASMLFPQKQWECVCGCLGRLESQYSRVELLVYRDSSNPESEPPNDLFDVFFDDD